jgi:glutamine synthetase
MFSTEGLALEDSFIKQVMTTLERMGIDVPQFGKEYGHGQYEMACHHGSPMQAVDDYFSLKEVVREAARRHGYIATFMPKLYPEWVGNSLHVHLSLWDAGGGRDLTPGTADNSSLSNLGQWFMGGLLAHAAALTGLGSPTVNSYKRLLPGSWAPANTYWGYGNRSGVVRIPGVGGRRHLEYRSGDNTCQPYLYMTGLLAAGLDGIRKRTDPGPPLQKDIGHLTQEQIEAFQIGFLPRTLPEALAALEADEVIAEAVGPDALRHFLLVKRNELADYNLEVHPWERSVYLEVP